MYLYSIEIGVKSKVRFKKGTVIWPLIVCGFWVQFGRKICTSEFSKTIKNGRARRTSAIWSLWKIHELCMFFSNCTRNSILLLIFCIISAGNCCILLAMFHILSQSESLNSQWIFALYFIFWHCISKKLHCF